MQNDPTRTTYMPVLPLNPAKLRKVCVVGPLADSPEHQMGNYYGKYADDAVSTPRSALEAELGAWEWQKDML